MKNNPVRGFEHLIGETIVKINATGINCVTLCTASGKIVVVHADSLHYGVPVVECEEMETQFVAKKGN